MALGASNPTSNLIQIKNIPIDNNKGTASPGTQRVVLADDNPTISAQLVAGTNIAGKTYLTDGTRDATVKAASTAAVATDTALVTALSPNTELPAGDNIIGKSYLTDGTRDATVKAASTAAVATDTALVTALSPNTELPAGDNIIGKSYLTDGTRDATVKAASTAAVATDTSIVTALSPNTPLPTGENTIGKINIVESYTEGVLSSGSEKLFLMGGIREDEPSVTTTANLQYSNLKVNNKGRLYSSITFDESLPEGSNAIGKLATNNANTYIGDVKISNTALPVQAATFNIIVSNIGVSGSFDCSATAYRLFVGQVVTITGTLSGSSIGNIVGYTGGPSTYRISSTDGVTQFTLTTLPGSPISTGPGLATGLVFTTTVPTDISNISRISGQTISMGSGVKDSGTLRVTIATNDVLTVAPIDSFTVNLATGTTVALAPGTQILTSSTTEQSIIDVTSIFLVGTTGQFLVPSTRLYKNSLVTLKGTAPSGTKGVINGYANPTTYRIIETNGSTTFSLINLDGTSLATTPGDTGVSSGLTAEIIIPYQVTQAGDWNIRLEEGSEVIGKVELIASNENIGKVELLESTASIGKVELLTSSVAIGKLSENSGVNIGEVTVGNSSLAVSQSGDWEVTSNYPMLTMSNIQIVGTEGQFSCSPIQMSVGQIITLNGVLVGSAVTGTIVGYNNPTKYKIQSTNGLTTFTLVTLTDQPLQTLIGSGITGLSGSLIFSSQIANISQLAGQNISMGFGVRDKGTQRITLATDDILSVSQNGNWSVALTTSDDVIGKLAENSGVNIGNVTLDNTSITVSQNTAANLQVEASLALNQTLSTVSNIIKLNGTDITMKPANQAALAADTALVVAVSPNTSVTVNQATASNLNVTAALASNQTLGTVTNLSKFNNQNISLNSGVSDAGTLRVSIATNDLVRTQGVSLSNASTTAFSNKLMIKASTGNLYMLTGYCDSLTGQFIQLHNTDDINIADGSIPVLTFFVPPKSNFSFDLGYYGRYFSTGIVICNSSTGPTLTIGGANCWFDAQYK